MGDPLCELTTLSKRAWVPVAVAVALFGLGLTVLSLLVSQGVNGATEDMLRFEDPMSLGITIAGLLFYTPMVWFWYTWQPRATQRVFNRLANEDFLGEVIPDAGATKLSLITRDLAQPLLPAQNKRRALLALVLITLVAFASWVFLKSNPTTCLNNAYCFGKSDTYLAHNTLYFEWVWTPILALQIVALVSIGIRQAYIAAAFSRLFRTRVVRPKLFDPDGCCGLAFVGNYVLKSAGIPVSVGAWIVFLVLYPSWVGPGAWISGVSIFYLVGYLLFPILFFTPAWSLYRALEVVRNKELRPWAEKVRNQTRTIVEHRQQIDEHLLEELDFYGKLEQAYQTIPFRRRGSIVFIVTYLIPLFSILLQVFLR